MKPPSARSGAGNGTHQIHHQEPNRSHLRQVVPLDGRRRGRAASQRVAQGGAAVAPDSGRGVSALAVGWGVDVDDSLSNGDKDELEEEKIQEGRVPFDRLSLDQYRVSSSLPLWTIYVPLSSSTQRGTLFVSAVKASWSLAGTAALTESPVTTSSHARCAPPTGSPSTRNGSSDCSSRCTQWSI